MKKFIIILLLMIIAIVITGCNLKAKNIFVENQQTQIGLIKKAINDSNYKICFKSQAYIYSGDDFSEEFTKEEAQDECLYKYALASLKIEVCERMSKKETIKNYYPKCVYEVQFKTNKIDEKNCQRIYKYYQSNLKRNTYIRYVLTNSSEYKQCISDLVKFTEDETICEKYKIPGEFFYSCYEAYSETKKYQSEQEEKKRKLNEDRNSIAEMKEINECENIYSDTKNECLIYFAKQNNDITICKSLGSGWDSSCYAQIAIISGNWLLCAKSTGDKIYKDKCYLTVSGVIKDSKICEAIENVNDKQLCIENVKK